MFLSKPIPAMKKPNKTVVKIFESKRNNFCKDNKSQSKFVREDNLQLDALTFFLIARSSLSATFIFKFRIFVESGSQPHQSCQIKKIFSTPNDAQDALQSMILC